MTTLSRREALRLMSLSVGALIAARCAPLADEAAPNPSSAAATLGPTSDTREAEVIVIGAGVSGLAAARTLADDGYSVILLEGRDRIGGRVWTDQSLGLPLDLGASWIHGTFLNPLTRLADRIGAKRVETDYDNLNAFNTDGQELSTARYLEMQALFAELQSFIADWAEDRDEDPSLGDAVTEFLERKDLSLEQLQQLHFSIVSAIDLDYATSPGDLSAWYYDDQSAYLGPDVLFPDGYGAIPNYLAQGLDIRLGHICTHIDYSADTVRVSTNQGQFSAPRVVVSLPLGVLKSGRVTFTPQLPDRKLAAMDGLGFGVLNKVYLQFPSVFWDAEADGLAYVSEQRGRFNAWINFAKINGQPILLAFNGGDFGFEIEDWSDEQIVAAAMETLRTIYGAAIPEPTNHLITRWSQDPFALGSYSAIMPGASGENSNVLAEALDDKLFFAGEATHRDHPSTVHGAYMSGLRAAEEIIESD